MTQNPSLKIQIHFQNVEFKSFVGNIFPAGELFIVATSEGRRHLVLVVARAPGKCLTNCYFSLALSLLMIELTISNRFTFLSH